MLGIVQVVQYVHARREVKRLQTDMDETYAHMVEQVQMLPKLIERHGPQEAMQLMGLASHLVEEGDFPDIKAAVASIERHHDFEPTNYDD
jgi:flagellar biosynthesis/type III secretory pathway ATPase